MTPKDTNATGKRSAILARTLSSRPGRIRRSFALLILLCALALASIPWTAVRLPALDDAAILLPVSPVMALVALLLDRRRPIAWAIAGAVLLLATSALAPEWSRRADAAPSDTPNRFVVVTHNVATANVDPEQTADLLLGSGADLVFLQETDGKFEPMIARLRTRFPYGSTCLRRCSLAILSRWPTDKIRYRFRDDSGHQVGPELIHTIIHLPGGIDVPVATVHLSRKLNADRRQMERESLATVTAIPGRDALILAGDFNALPWSAGMRKLDASLAPMRRVTRGLPSFPARLTGGTKMFPFAPIDHVYVGPHWSLVSLRRLGRTGSDHFPVRVELVWQGGGAVVARR